MSSRPGAVPVVLVPIVHSRGENRTFPISSCTHLSSQPTTSHIHAHIHAHTHTHTQSTETHTFTQSLTSISNFMFSCAHTIL